MFYFFSHSLFASNAVKNIVMNRMPGIYRFYRLIYSGFSVVGLFALFFLNSSMGSPNFFDPNGIPRYLSLMFAAFGVILIKIVFRSYSLSSFIGLSEEKGQVLVTSGILGSIRHPIYSGTILIAIGFWLFSPNLPTLVSVICIFVYIPIGIIFEERKLIRQFGEAYAAYRTKVPALIPRIF